MARLILDTSTLIEAERGNGDLVDRIENVDDVAISAVTVAELRVGIGLTKGRRRANRELFIASILDSISIETYDLEVAEAHAQLMVHVRRAGTPRGAHDLIIAATALARDRLVLTLDRGGFEDLPGVPMRCVD